MDTKQLVKNLSENTGETAQVLDSFIDSLVSVIRDRCCDMDSVAIPGFGTFEPRKRLERITIHPSTGKRILIPPKVSLTFKMSAVIKQKLKNNVE